MKYKSKILRERRRTLSIKVEEDGTLLIRVPYLMSDYEMEREINRHKEWIERHLRDTKKYSEKPDSKPDPARKPVQSKYTEKEIQEMKKLAQTKIIPLVEVYAKIIGVTYGRITIRSQKTRWGSCSSKGNLNFNCLLSQMPQEIIEYIVVHELCHRKEMNHSKQFWYLVEQVLPDYKKRNQWLKDNGYQFVRRLK